MNRQTDYDEQTKKGLTLVGGNEKNTGGFFERKDKKKEEESEIESYVTTDIHGHAVSKSEAIMVKVSHVFAWLAAAIWIVACIMNVRIGIMDLSTLDRNLINTVVAWVICGIVFTVDALILNLKYNKNVSLFIVAWIFNFGYLSKRTFFLKYKSNALSVFMSFIMLVSTLTCGYVVYRYYNEYSIILSIEDEEQRDEVREFLKLEDRDGVTYAKNFSEIFDMRSIAAYTTQNNEKKIVVLAAGQYDAIPEICMKSEKKLKKGTKKFFIDKGENNVTTLLTFVKTDKGTEYQLKGVTLNGKVIKYRYVFNYWDVIRD